jgi:thiol-disulfide isomerase/thioredoxin
MGKTLTKTGFQTLRGSDFSDEKLNGGVVVLHFWGYQDKPLREPYGQVGYLDFLYRKYNDKGLKVFGIVADPKLEDENLRALSLRSARKFVSFMNVGYPVLVDNESYLRKVLGDPRAAGARLPLFLVLDKQGKIVHYHVGFYEIDRDRGLRELDAEVVKALEMDE